jgi:hypothetical protein
MATPLLGYLEGALLTPVAAAAWGRVAGIPVLALLAKGDETDGQRAVAGAGHGVAPPERVV